MPKFTTISTKSKTNVRIAALLTVLIGVSLVGYFFVIVPIQTLSGDNVGKLEPTEPPGSLSYSLEDIYNKLVNGASADLNKKKSSPAFAPGDTQVTLDNIYQNIPQADKICKGTNAGTADCEGIVSTPTPVETVTPTPAETATPSPSPSPSPVAQENLVLWLKLDETTKGEFGTKFTDSSGSKNSGTCPSDNCPIVGAEGKANKAVDFDGTNDYITFPKEFSTTNGITVESWINAKEISSQIVNTIYSVGAQNNTSTGYHFFFITKPANTSYIGWQMAQTGKWSGKYQYASLNLNQWYHLVVTHDYASKTVVLYVNGFMQKVFTGDEVIPVSNKTAFIGAYGGYYHFFKGLLDEFKIYNKALSEEEVEKEYDSYQ